MIIKKPAILESIVPAAEGINLYRFRLQDHTPIDFTPGMFAMLYYKDPNTGEEIGRAYSIANEPGSDYLEFIIELVHGRLTSKLEEAKTGDIYYLSAPYGQFKFDLSKKKSLFLAGGTGIAPFFSMIRYSIKQNLDIDVVMLYSARHVSWIILKDMLESFERNANPRIHTIITITRPQEEDKGWNGLTGHIDANMIKANVPDYAERVFYICGPLGFVKAMKDVAEQLGIQKENIKQEMWGEE